MESKICPNCNTNKSILEYYKCLSRKDGLQVYCKICKTEKFRESKKLSDIKYQKKYFTNPLNILHKNEYNKIYQNANPSKQKEYSNNFKKSDKGIKYYKEYRKAEYDIKYGVDMIFTLKLTLRNRLKNAVLKEFKKGKTLDFLGCSIEEFKLYLEKQFDEVMNWSNYGKDKYWELDHIKPCDAFNLMEESEQRECFHYTNIRPYPITKNRQKSNKY